MFRKFSKNKIKKIKVQNKSVTFHLLAHHGHPYSWVEVRVPAFADTAQVKRQESCQERKLCPVVPSVNKRKFPPKKQGGTLCEVKVSEVED